MKLLSDREIAARVCQGMPDKDRNLEVLGRNGDWVLVKHCRHGHYRSRSRAELFNLKTMERRLLWQGVKLVSAKKKEFRKKLNALPQTETPRKFATARGWTRVHLPFDWAHTWELRSYTSPSRMRRDGFDNQRGEPKYPDDELRLEYHLYLGMGLDTDSPDSYVGFCASNRVPCR